MMNYYNNGYYDFLPLHFFEMIFMALFWGVVIYSLVYLFRNIQNHHKNQDPINILKERYAKGEITKEEFDSMKKDLK